MYRCVVFFWVFISSILFSAVISAETAVTHGGTDSVEPMISAVNVKFVIHIPAKLSLKVDKDPEGQISIESESNIPGKQMSESVEGWIVSVP